MAVAAAHSAMLGYERQQEPLDGRSIGLWATKMESYMRKLFVTLCAAASIFSAAAFFSTTPAEAWGYRHHAYRHHAYRHYVYRPYYSYAYYRPYYYRPYYSYAYYRPYYYRPYYSYAYYRPYYYRPYYSYAYYRPYRAYAYAGYGPRIWVGWGRRWR